MFLEQQTYVVAQTKHKHFIIIQLLNIFIC